MTDRLFEITWHGEGTATLRASGISRDAVESLKNLIEADPNLVVCSITETDENGVDVRRSPLSAPTRRFSIDMADMQPRRAAICVSGVGPSLCSEFPQCGHLAVARRAVARSVTATTRLAP